MAKIAKSDVVVGGKCPLPKNLYRARIIGTKYGKSAKGYDMTTLTCEVISPESVNVDGNDYRIAGRQFNLWLMHVPGETWGQAQVFDFMDKLGIVYGDEYDTERHEEYFKGVEFDIILDSQEEVKRMAPKAGQKQGDPILDGEGNKISDGYRILANLSDVPSQCRPTRVSMAY